MSQQINLYSPIFLAKKKYFSAITLLQGLALIVISAGVFYAYAMYQVSALGTQAADTDKRLAVERTRLAKVTAEFSPRQQNSALEEEVRLAEARLATNQKIVQLFKSSDVSATKGFSEFMRALARQSVNGLWLTSFDVSGSGSNMTVSGRTQLPALVPVYLQRLNGEPTLRGRQLATLQIRQTSSEAILAASNSPAYLEFYLSTLPTLATPPAVTAKAGEEEPVPIAAVPGQQPTPGLPMAPPISTAATLPGEKKP